MIAHQLTIDDALTGPPPQPCVVCEGDAAANWLLCLDCAAKVDDTMVLDLAHRYDYLGTEWLPEAENLLRDMDTSDERYQRGLALWSRRFLIHRRIGWLLHRVGQG